ncbi:mannose-6-phosphate isomerase [Pelosinus sp. IPA-1]|nr:mannose-6-phosphate isomerase [Pelosinus sp. IPA-1]
MYDRKVPISKIGESWELCSHKKGMSVVANGNLSGKTLQELVEEHKIALLGSKYDENRNAIFPLMIKIIDANDNLSIQVHPEDKYAYRVEGESGKTEAWYVIAAKENAQIVYGLKDSITKEEFRQAILNNSICDTLRFVPVTTGDMIFIPAGTVHALLDGIMVYEVQQNSDITYRVYDFDRFDSNGKGRELHIDKAMDVIKYDKQENIDFKRTVVECEYFSMKKMKINEEKRENSEGQFIIYCVTKGNGQIVYSNGLESIVAGDTVLIPACIGSFSIKGNMELLKIK